MSHLLIRDEVFTLASPLGETNLQTLIEQNVHLIAPTYFILKFDCLVDSRYGSARADLAFVHKRFHNWYVIEVELLSHPLNTHVLPQVQKLYSGVYHDRHVSNLLGQLGAEHEVDVNKLVQYCPPHIMVIADGYDSLWHAALDRVGVRYSSFEVYKTRHDEFCFRYSGHEPEQLADRLCRCRFHSGMNWLLELVGQVDLQFDGSGSIEIEWHDRITKWKSIAMKQSVCLMPTGENPLNPQSSYYLTRKEDGGLEFQEFIEVLESL